MKQIPLYLMAVAIFLAPIIGGYVSVDAVPSSGLWLPGKMEYPLLSHAVIGLLFSAALAIVGWRAHIIQMAHPKIAVPFGIFVTLISISISWSHFTATSVKVALEFLAYSVAFAAVIAASGRSFGPKLLLGSLFAGGVAISFIGIMEYGAARADDPTWRVFSTWINQNALAGMLTLTIFAGYALLFSGFERYRIHLVILQSAQFMCLILAQSKGGFVACGVGLIWMAVATLKTDRKMLKWLGAPLGVAALFGIALGSSGVFNRIAHAGNTSEQSAGFRQLLWKSAIRLATENPVGSGIGTFRYLSSRPGIVSPTEFAHSSYLQLACEAGWLALLALAVFLISSASFALRGPSIQPLGRSAIVAGIIALLIHNQIDSLLYHFGIGIAFFALIAIALLWSGDGLTPEFVPTFARRFAISFLAGLVALGMVHGALVEHLKSSALASDSSANAERYLETAAMIAPYDGEVFYLRGLLLDRPNTPDRLKDFQLANSKTPSLRYGRALASELPNDQAIAKLRQCLTLDPNNLLTLIQIMRRQEQAEDRPAAEATARQLIAAEDSTSYKIRAIPEIIPTETLEAREYLAQTATPTERARLWRQAVLGYRKYASITWPRVKPFKEIVGGNYGGDTYEGGLRKLAHGRELCQQLADLYRSLGDAPSASEVASWESDFNESGKGSMVTSGSAG